MAKYIKHSPTSRDAAMFAEQFADNDRTQVFLCILRLERKLGIGATDDEMQREMKMNPSTQRPRRRELEEAGIIENSGHKRPTSTGNQAFIWRPTGKQYLSSLFNDKNKKKRRKEAETAAQREQRVLKAAYAYRNKPTEKRQGRLLRTALHLMKKRS